MKNETGPESMLPGNVRSSSRVPFQATVSLQFPSLVFDQCETRDLSVKGVFVVGVSGPDVNDTCTAELCLSGTKSKVCLRMESRVVRVATDGMALRFTSMDSDSFFHLKKIVYYNSRNPDDLEDYHFEDVAGD